MVRTPPNSSAARMSDDAFTVIAISVLAAICANVIHEGLGHAATALLTGAQSGVLTTVAWTSDFDSRLVAAAGTLANLAAAILFWIALRSLKRLKIHLRFFLLLSFAFNVLDGTGYFLFSGVANFGDWATVIAGLAPGWMWRTVLAVGGAAAYYAASLVVGIGLVRYVGIRRDDQSRLRRLTLIAYVTSILLACAGALLNPFGIQLLWQSALPATLGGHSALMWLQYAIPRNAKPARADDRILRSYSWIAIAAVIALAYLLVLGRGVTLRR
jgi:hypothetical protein